MTNNTLYIAVVRPDSCDLFSQPFDPVTQTEQSVLYAAEVKFGARCYRITESVYRAVRSARIWFYTEPGNAIADKQFKYDLVRSGCFQDTGNIDKIEVAHWNPDKVLLRSMKEHRVIVIDAKLATVEIFTDFVE